MRAITSSWTPVLLLASVVFGDVETEVHTYEDKHLAILPRATISNLATPVALQLPSQGLSGDTGNSFSDIGGALANQLAGGGSPKLTQLPSVQAGSINVPVLPQAAGQLSSIIANGQFTSGFQGQGSNQGGAATVQIGATIVSAPDGQLFSTVAVVPIGSPAPGMPQPTSVAGDALPQAGQPQGQSAAPQGQSAAPQEQPAAPQEQPAAPQGQSTTSQEQSTISQGQSTISQGQSTISQGQSTTSPGQSTTSPGQSTMPREQSTTSQELSVQSTTSRRMAEKENPDRSRTSTTTLGSASFQFVSSANIANVTQIAGVAMATAATASTASAGSGVTQGAVSTKMLPATTSVVGGSSASSPVTANTGGATSSALVVIAGEGKSNGTANASASVAAITMVAGKPGRNNSSQSVSQVASADAVNTVSGTSSPSAAITVIALGNSSTSGASAVGAQKVEANGGCNCQCRCPMDSFPMFAQKAPAFSVGSMSRAPSTLIISAPAPSSTLPASSASAISTTATSTTATSTTATSTTAISTTAISTTVSSQDQSTDSTAMPTSAPSMQSGNNTLDLSKISGLQSRVTVNLGRFAAMSTAAENRA